MPRRRTRIKVFDVALSRSPKTRNAAQPARLVAAKTWRQQSLENHGKTTAVNLKKERSHSMKQHKHSTSPKSQPRENYEALTGKRFDLLVTPDNDVRVETEPAAIKTEAGYVPTLAFRFLNPRGKMTFISVIGSN
jgi:hypothetical protein